MNACRDALLRVGFRRLGWVVLGCVLGLAPTADSQAQVRTWTDSTGKHTIQAKFVEVANGKVTLERADGTQFAIDLKKLSEADQKFVAEQQGDSPFEQLPSQPKKAGASGAEESEGDDARAPGGATAPIDWSAANEIDIVGGNRWEVPLAQPPGLGFEPKPVPLSKKQHFFEGMQPLAVNPGCKRAAIGYLITFSVPTPVTRVVLADLATGKMVASEPLEACMRPAALLHDGKTIVMVGCDDRAGTADQLEFWTFQGRKVKRSATWRPYAEDGSREEKRPGRFGRRENQDAKVAFAESVNETTLLTCSTSGHLVAWDHARRQPIWHMRLQGAPTVAYSADRQMMVFAQANQFLVVRTKDGEIIGQVSLADKGHLPWPSFAISPSGRKIALSSSERLLLFDVEKKEWLDEVQLSGYFGGHAVGFPDEEYVLFDGKLLIHWPSRIRLWEYADVSATQVVGEYAFFGLTSDGGGLLYPTKLPHPKAVAMLESARQRSDIFIVRPGVALALDVNGVAQQYQATVRESLEKAIGKIGCQVAPQAEVQVVATITGPKQEAAAYHMAGAHVVQKYTSRVALRFANNDVWVSEGTNIPGMVMLQGGETLEQFLAKASQAPNLEHFKRIVLPEYLQKPAPAPAGGGARARQQMTIGVSKLTINGFD